MKNCKNERIYSPPTAMSVKILIENSVMTTSGDEGNLAPIPDGFDSNFDSLF